MRLSRIWWRPIGLVVLVAWLVVGDAAAQDGAHRGYLAVRLVGGGDYEVVDALNAERLFVPASVLKLVTAAAVLEHLGPDYRWQTRLVSSRPARDGVLEGDLVIEPGADPTWNDDAPEPGVADAPERLARQVRARGITRIAGDVVVDTGRFPGRSHPTDRSYGDLPYRHGTPPAALATDEATITVRVAPGRAVGDPARVTVPDDLDLINLTTTVGRDRHGAGTLDFVPVWGTGTLVLRGEYPISEPPFVVSASDPTPELRAARRVRRALVEAGVTVDGEVRRDRSPNGSEADETVLAVLHSPPLRQVLERMLTDSHNWYADVLTLTLGLEVAGSGRFDDGVDVISDFVEARVMGGNGARRTLLIGDGSGLSSSNLVTPGTVVAVLAYAIEQPWGTILIEALATPGRGTLAAWPRLPRLAAKTGTLRHTVGLAGVLDLGPDPPVVFCYFVNHHPGRPSAARAEIASAVGRWRTVRASR